MLQSQTSHPWAAFTSISSPPPVAPSPLATEVPHQPGFPFGDISSSSCSPPNLRSKAIFPPINAKTPDKNRHCFSKVIVMKSLSTMQQSQPITSHLRDNTPPANLLLPHMHPLIYPPSSPSSPLVPAPGKLQFPQCLTMKVCNPDAWSQREMPQCRGLGSRSN